MPSVPISGISDSGAGFRARGPGAAVQIPHYRTRRAAVDVRHHRRGRFRGEIYHIDPGSQKLPNFSKLKPVGAIYTPYLCVPLRSFDEGFPGVAERFEWFAMDFTGRFWSRIRGLRLGPPRPRWSGQQRSKRACAIEQHPSPPPARADRHRKWAST
jgi:hypothetical protein